MRLVRKLAVGMAAVMLSASAAMAADPIFIPPPPAPPPMAAPVAYNWAGPHAGALIIRPIGGPAPILLAGQVGFNIQRNNLVFGFDTRFGRLPGGGPFWVGAGGKVGLALGARGNILVYGTGALAFVLVGPPDIFYIFGGGAEFGISDRLSIFAELLALGEPGPGGGCCLPAMAAGVNFHVGN